MKNVIVAGVPRAGKTLLCQRLNKELGVSHIPTDPIISSFQYMFPEHGILHDGDLSETCQNFDGFLRSYLINLEYLKIPFCLDGFHILPEQMIKHGWDKKYVVVFLGYSNISVDEKINSIRKYSSDNDWAQKISDEEIEKLVQKHINTSRQFEKTCQSQDIAFFDTGMNFNQAINDVYEYVTKRIS